MTALLEALVLGFVGWLLYQVEVAMREVLASTRPQRVTGDVASYMN